jgi:predicted small secreted protein
MKQHKPLLASVALSALLLSGCATAAGSVTAPSDVSTAGGPPATTAEASHHGAHHGQEAPSRGTTADAPSAAALMVCGDQPKERLRSILDLDSDPHTINNWADSTFTCTYHLAEGALVISVQEAADQASARTYFDAMQALAKDATPIKGLANLGFPAYETADGSAVFQKDSFVLKVDASDLPGTLAPDNISRNALAYQLSTTILACWVEHH